MASTVAAVIFTVIALVFAGISFLDMFANAQARVTGGDAGGVSLLPPLVALACGALAVWLFLS